MSRKHHQRLPFSPSPSAPDGPATAAGIHLISAEKIENMATEDKVRFILDEVEAGKILILERGLTPQEEALLIEATMRDIDQDRFIGIEMQSYGMDRGKNMLQRVVMGGPRPRMAVIGPASLLKLVSKDNEKIVTQIIGSGVAAPVA